jgi:hypothetical protein
VACRIALLSAVLIGAAGAEPSSHGEPRGFCLEVPSGESREDPGAYARRAGGSYCDGVVFQRHSGRGDLPVIGVMGAPVTGDPRKAALRITVLAPPEGVSGIAWPLHLKGLARSPDVNYRLDAALLSVDQPVVIGPDSAMSRIPRPRGRLRTSDEHLCAEDIAWVAWTDSLEHGRTYLPVTSAGASGGAVEIIVRPTVIAAYLKYSVLSEDRNLLGKETMVEGNSSVGSGEAITITIPAGVPRVVVVSVLALGSDGNNQAASVRLVRPAPSKK